MNDMNLTKLNAPPFKFIAPDGSTRTSDRYIREGEKRVLVLVDDGYMDIREIDNVMHAFCVKDDR